MDSTMSLSIGFKGQLNLNAQAVPLQEGYLKIGGIVDDDATNGLDFGVVASASPTTPNTIAPGVASGNVIRGIAVFDDAIAQNAPSHAGKYLASFPCAVLNHGFLWLASWDKTASGSIEPVLGCRVIYNTTTGVIGFFASTGDVPSGYAVLSNADVRAIDDVHGALIYIN